MQRVRDIWNKNKDCLSGEEVESLYKNLQKLTKVSEETKEVHIQNIKIDTAFQKKKPPV